MAFLLKVTGDALANDVAVVPRMKSVALNQDDTGESVFIWRGADHDQSSALFGIATLAAFEAVKIPQTRDPARIKDAYRLSLADIRTDVLNPLSTEDLGPYRYVEGADGIESLGRLHKDRNDKIIRLTGAEATVLSERLGQ